MVLMETSSFELSPPSPLRTTSFFTSKSPKIQEEKCDLGEESEESFQPVSSKIVKLQNV